MRIILNGRLACQDLGEQQRYTQELSRSSLPTQDLPQGSLLNEGGPKQASGKGLGTGKRGSREKESNHGNNNSLLFEHLGHATHCLTWASRGWRRVKSTCQWRHAGDTVSIPG